MDRAQFVSECFALAAELINEQVLAIDIFVVVYVEYFPHEIELVFTLVGFVVVYCGVVPFDEVPNSKICHSVICIIV